MTRDHHQLLFLAHDTANRVGHTPVECRAFLPFHSSLSSLASFLVFYPNRPTTTNQRRHRLTPANQPRSPSSKTPTRPHRSERHHRRRVRRTNRRKMFAAEWFTAVSERNNHQTSRLHPTNAIELRTKPRPRVPSPPTTISRPQGGETQHGLD